MQQLETVLVPTDGSDGALAGAQWAVELAGRLGAALHVLSVVDTGDSAVIDSVREPTRIVDALETEAHDATAAVETLAEASAASPPVTTAVRRGSPHETIRSYASQQAADVIVMGTTGRSGLNRLLLGSTTERVLRTTTRPLLAVPPGAGDREVAFDQLLLPTDGSQEADIAVDWGVWLARELDAMVHALYAVETSRLPTATVPSELLDQLETAGQTALERVRSRAKAAGVRSDGTVTSGPPARAILGAIEPKEADLVVMGTRGRHGVSQQLLGSVTEHVVRHAPVAVLCVPVAANTADVADAADEASSPLDQ